MEGSQAVTLKTRSAVLVGLTPLLMPTRRRFVCDLEKRAEQRLREMKLSAQGRHEGQKQAKLDQANQLIGIERDSLMHEFSLEVNAGRFAAECELERRTQILAAQLRAAEATIAAESAE